VDVSGRESIELGVRGSLPAVVQTNRADGKDQQERAEEQPAIQVQLPGEAVEGLVDRSLYSHEKS